MNLTIKGVHIGEADCSLKVNRFDTKFIVSVIQSVFCGRFHCVIIIIIIVIALLLDHYPRESN